MNQDDRLGPYRLLRRLGEGGMGVVHLAVDPHGRQVALKVLRAEVAGDEVARRRLSREVETMRRIRSAFIAEVLDADVTGRRPYIVTRYVPGRPLDELVKTDGPLDPPGLARLAHGVAAALAVVHSVGVIHRDLKPGNVLILDGRPVLIDFGIAQAVDATRLTQTGMFIGTPQYLAPEIIEGHEAGPEVDVHAWAGTLLYAATGQPPFGKGTLEMIFYNITAGKADAGAAPAELQPLLRAAFQRDPAKRPSSAELAERAARLLSPEGSPDEIPTVPRAGRHTAPPGEPFVSLLPARGLEPGAPPAPAQPQVLAQPPVSAQPPVPGSAQPPASVPAQPPTSVRSPDAAQPWHSPQRAHQPAQPIQPAGPVPPDPSGRLAQHAGRYGGLGPGESDPFPTRRVSPEELRQVREEQYSRPWPGREALAPGHGRQGAPVSDLSGYGVSAPGVSGHDGHGVSPPGVSGHGRHGTPSPGVFAPGASAPGYDVPTRRVRTDLPDYHRAQPPHSPEPPAEREPSLRREPSARRELSAEREPSAPGVRPGGALRDSRSYAVISALLLIMVIVLAALAPVLVAAVVVPVAVLLRAADLAQPRLAAGREGRAAADVLRVLAHPRAVLKSLGITLVLTLYAAILGLPVTLLLTVVLGMAPGNALAWGAAVALWTLCAGPGVEGPSRQLRGTLASLVPSRQAAMALAGVLAVVAAGSLWLAYGTADQNSGRTANWTPVRVDSITGKLSELRGRNSG